MPCPEACSRARFPKDLQGAPEAKAENRVGLRSLEVILRAGRNSETGPRPGLSAQSCTAGRPWSVRGGPPGQWELAPTLRLAPLSLPLTASWCGHSSEVTGQCSVWPSDLPALEVERRVPPGAGGCPVLPVVPSRASALGAQLPHLACLRAEPPALGVHRQENPPTAGGHPTPPDLHPLLQAWGGAGTWGSPACPAWGPCCRPWMR